MRHEQADGRATLEWVTAQPWFDGRLVMWGASYLGLTEWAVAEDAPDFVKALCLQVTASEISRRTSIRAAPSRSRRRWPGCTSCATRSWGGAPSCGRGCAAPGWSPRRPTSCPSGSATPPWSASPCPSSRTGSRTAPRVTPGGSPRTSGAAWRRCRRPASSAAGTTSSSWPRWPTTRPCATPGAPARLTIGPWTHASPGLFAETVRDGPRWFDEQLDAPGSRPAAAPVRVFVMGSRTWQEFSMWPPAGETVRWYLGRGGTLTQAPPAESAPDRYHYNPHDPTPAVGGPSLNMATAGRKEQHRRERRRDVLTYTSPVLAEDLTVIGPVTATLHLRSSLGHTDFFVRRADVSEKGKVVQPERRHRPADPRLGRAGTGTASSRSTSPCGPPPTRSWPGTASASRSPAAPTRSSTATWAPENRWRQAPIFVRRTRRCSTTPRCPSSIALHAVDLLRGQPAGRAWNGSAGRPRLVSRR